MDCFKKIHVNPNYFELFKMILFFKKKSKNLNIIQLHLL
jgi:hypothetical protein